MVFVLLTLGLIVLILIGFPVGFAAGLVSLLGAADLFGGLFQERVATMLARTFSSRIDSYLLLSVPFFILAGRLMNSGGVTDRLFGFISLLVQPVKGGLGHANVLSSMAFAGMSGSATADAMGLGTIEMRAMTRAGYDREFSAGITAASSLIGPIIPPSIAMVAYAVEAEVSVAAMFIGGIVPGVLMALSQMAYVAHRARRDNFPRGAWPGLHMLGASFSRAILPMLTPVIIMGGIYLGVFTPTEAAAVAACYAMGLGTLFYREYGIASLYREIRATMIDSAVIMLIIAFTSGFGVIMIRGHVPDALAAMMVGMTTDPTLLMMLFVVLWMIVGCFMAQTPAIIILTPILLPVATQYGIDPVYFGIVMTVTLTLGLITPPVGMVLYALVKVTGLSFERLALISVPYIVITLAVIALLVMFPQLVMFLPNAIQ